MLDKDAMNKLVELIQLQDDVREGLLQKVAELEAANTALQAQLSEKTAAAAPSIDPSRIETTVDSLIKAGLFEKQERKEVLANFSSVPDFAFSCLDKLAEYENERKKELKPIGRLVPATEMKSSAASESDRIYDEGIQALSRYV